MKKYVYIIVVIWALLAGGITAYNENLLRKGEEDVYKRQSENSLKDERLIPVNSWGTEVEISQTLVNNNLHEIQTNIAHSKVKIVAVTKYYGLSAILAGYEAGTVSYTHLSNISSIISSSISSGSSTAASWNTSGSAVTAIFASSITGSDRISGSASGFSSTTTGS